MDSFLVSKNGSLIRNTDISLFDSVSLMDMQHLSILLNYCDKHLCAKVILIRPNLFLIKPYLLKECSILDLI